VSTQSVAEFGGYSTNYMREPSVAPVYVPAYNSLYWLIKVDGFRIGQNLNSSDG